MPQQQPAPGLGAERREKGAPLAPGAPSQEPRGNGSLAAAVSTAMVQILRRYSGRGPTRARATLGRDHVVILLRDALTTAERTLVEDGAEELVLQTRRALQSAMRLEAVKMVEELCRREVIGFMSDNQIEPDLSVEIFVFEPTTTDVEVHEAEAGD